MSSVHHFSCPEKTNLEKKKDELVGKVAMPVDKTTKKTFAELVHCVGTKISVPIGRKCFFQQHAQGGGWGYFRSQVTGMI